MKRLVISASRSRGLVNVRELRRVVKTIVGWCPSYDIRIKQGCKYIKVTRSLHTVKNRMIYTNFMAYLT